MLKARGEWNIMSSSDSNKSLVSLVRMDGKVGLLANKCIYVLYDPK
jgi:hypothetical protein